LTVNEDHQLDATGRERLLKQLDKMVASGRVTETEAAQLRAARDSDEFDQAARDIRVRHAREHLNAAVEGGQMTQQEANSHLEGLKRGEHSRSLRAHLRSLLPGR
jgi:polyhydroxyalkanoate synthesis regulator phasin